MMKKLFMFCYALCFFAIVQGNARDFIGAPTKAPSAANYRANCIESRSQTDLAINNVRARLRGGGDMWWDGVQARYIVPNVDPASGEPEISSLFSGGIWLGAFDKGGNLILSAQTYRSSGNDYWSGPLNPDLGTIEKNECENWDKHFTVYGADIDALRADYLDPLSPGVQNTPSKGLLGWPGKGNPNFLAIHGFDILNYNQDLAPFIDVNKDEIYNPWDGDHPIIEVTGCEDYTYNNPIYADQMTWWVYNDNGNVHGQSQGSPMQMEVQVTAFGYATTDAVNDMTFYRYKLLNRNVSDLYNTYFSLWSDPDLGCPDDDYIGCDTTTGMGYVYNKDANDDNPCGNTGIAGYGTDIPALGVDYFRGPLDSAGNQIGLSSFMYHVNNTTDIGDPTSAWGYYRLMSGAWKNGTPVTAEGNGYNPNNPNAAATNYVFPSFPNQQGAGTWSMCNENLSGLDQRFLHTSGPFTLKAGTTNEMISGVVWVPSIPDYPCPSLRPLVAADKLAQNLFDNCFKITNGPDAPNIDIIEMNEELVLNLTNEANFNNSDLNYWESPAELKPYAPLDTTYNFQGYKVYQVISPNISVTELDDETKARLVAQTDVKDDISTQINWKRFVNEATQVDVPVPTIMVEGENKGLKHTFRIVEDLFSKGNKKLINHRPYYYCVVAYAHNEYKKYDPITNEGQAKTYLQGRRNFKIYTGVPRINASEYSGVVLQSSYGDQPEITRLEGQGVGSGEFLDISNSKIVEKAIVEGQPIGEITYLAGRGPVGIKIVDPLRVPRSRFKMHICDQHYQWNYDSQTKIYYPVPPVSSKLSDSVYWVLTDVNDATRFWSSLQPMGLKYEQYIPDLGIAIEVEQKEKPSQKGTVGYIGSRIVYDDSTTYGKWYQGLEDGDGVRNMLKTKQGEDDYRFDPEQLYSTSIGGWYPFMLCDAEQRFGDYYLSLGNIGSHGARFRNDNSNTFNNISNKVRDTLLSALNNVNIVLTANKAEWSRCIVVETANMYHGSGQLGAGSPTWRIPSNRKQMEWKGSVGINKPVYYSRNKDMSIDPTSVGMSWFPGYAYDVETGQRLNLFFGENSLYDGTILLESVNAGCNTGNDMIFNPTATQMTGAFSTDNKVQFLQSVMGGQHIIYVTNTSYDSCKSVLAEFNKVPIGSPLSSDNFIYQSMKITWASMAVPTKMTGVYGEVPPTKATIQLRVDRPFELKQGIGQNEGYPLYEFSLEHFTPQKEVKETAVAALDLMRVVPNPYYTYSEYEVTEQDNIVKIINIPAKCEVQIYSLDGRFVKSYKAAQDYYNSSYSDLARIGKGIEGPTAEAQITTSVEWDLKNYASVPVSSGVYLIHVKVEGVGTKVLKSFVINRAFDAQRL